MAIFENIIMVFMTIIIIVLYLIYQTLCNIQLKNKKIIRLLTIENYSAPTSIPITFSIDSGYNYRSSCSIDTHGKHSITLQNGATVNLRGVEYFIKRMTIDLIFTNNKKITVHLTTGRTSNFEIPKGEIIDSLQLQLFEYYTNANNSESPTKQLTLQQCLTDNPVSVYVTLATI